MGLKSPRLYNRGHRSRDLLTLPLPLSLPGLQLSLGKSAEKGGPRCRTQVCGGELHNTILLLGCQRVKGWGLGVNPSAGLMDLQLYWQNLLGVEDSGSWCVSG